MFKCKYTQESTIMIKYFTLGGVCFSTERPIYTINSNKKKYFTLGGCFSI